MAILIKSKSVVLTAIKGNNRLVTEGLYEGEGGGGDTMTQA